MFASGFVLGAAVPLALAGWAIWEAMREQELADQDYMD